MVLELINGRGTRGSAARAPLHRGEAVGRARVDGSTLSVAIDAPPIQEVVEGGGAFTGGISDERRLGGH
jgi:hypothetical protein